MESSNEPQTENPSRKRLLIVGVACIVFLVAGNIAYRAFVPPLKGVAKPSLPDVASCTRLEIRFWESAMDYVDTACHGHDILSPAESQHLQSLTTITVSDPQRIEAIARKLSGASHVGHMRDYVGRRSIEFGLVCYRDSNRLASLRVSFDTIVVDDGHRFRLEKGGLHTAILTQPAIRPLLLRAQCALSLTLLASVVRHDPENRQGYPPPSNWCSALARTGVAMYGKKAFAHFLRCPAAGKGKCHYAMNPHCKADSPSDMVLLFEARAGWNQHGGLALFTFDNHDPKGGCVLLKDETVKFIRTKEELHALRWE